MRWMAALAVFGCLSASLFGCETPRRSYGPAVGVILDYTGTEASGFNEEQAFLLAAQLMDEARPGEPPFRLVFKDAHNSPERARRAAQEMVEEDVDVVIGPATDLLVPVVKEVLDETDIVLVSANATIGGLEDQARPWFRMSPGNLTGSTTPELIGEHMAAELVSRGFRRALIVSDDDVYDVDVTRGFKSALASRGGEVVAELSAVDSQSQSLISALSQQDVDAVVVAVQLLPAARLITDVYSSTPARPRWLLTPPLKSEVLLLNTPFASLEGAFGVSLRIHGRSSGCTAPVPEGCFTNTFRKTWGGEPFEDSYFMYDAAAVALIAADRVWRQNGSVDRAQLAQAIFTTADRGGVLIGWNDFAIAVEAASAGAGVQYSGVTGAIVFTPSGVRVGGETVPFEVTDNVFVDVN